MNIQFIRACKAILNKKVNVICPKSVLRIRYQESVTHEECRAFFGVPKKYQRGGGYCPCHYFQGIKGMTEEETRTHMLKIIAEVEK